MHTAPAIGERIIFPDTCAHCIKETTVAQLSKVDKRAIRCLLVHTEYGFDPKVTDSKQPIAKMDPTCAAADEVIPNACFMYVGTNKRYEINTMRQERDVKCNQKPADANCFLITLRVDKLCFCGIRLASVILMESLLSVLVIDDCTRFGRF